MHAGKSYPFHPVYWVTEGWFWPGFCPWKLDLDVYNNGSPPWNIFHSGYFETSEPGIISNNRQSVAYPFTAHFPSYALRVILDTTTFAGVKQCRWTMSLLSGVVEWARAVELKPVPQYRIFNRTWTYVMPDPPYTANDPPPYQVTPSPYFIGGSPWPLY